MSDDRPVHHPTAYDRRYKRNPEYMADQRARMKARYWAIKRLGEKALQGKDLDHVKPLAAGGSNEPGNLRIRSVSENRGDKDVFKRAGYEPRHVA